MLHSCVASTSRMHVLVPFAAHPTQSQRQDRAPATDVMSVERLQHQLRAGLDMLNHSAARNCYWKVQGCLTDTSATIELKALRGLKPDTEACIAYEQESNEAMMFRYGFVELNNAQDAVMLRCPLGPTEEWDEVMHRKVELLQVCIFCTVCWLPRWAQAPVLSGVVVYVGAYLLAV